MSIVETMLEKTKARQGTAPEHDTRATPLPHTHGHRDRELEPPPASSLCPVPIRIDAELARENRVLLGGGDSKDRGVMAAYGMLRTRLLHRARAKHWTSIGITSPAPQDGKSLTAVNLALSLAREGNSTIALLDCDLWNPSVCPILGIAPPIELRECLMGLTPPQDQLFVSIGLDNLTIAGNTVPTENSAELLASGRLEELLEFLRRSIANPLILIDLPPIVSPDDALVVAPKLDALLLVASEGVTPRAELEKARDLVAHFPLAGFVLNRSVEMTRKYAYSYGYESRYRRD
jgi:protein-tyrosine kinase